ncbi:MAG TPA: MBL fold metallo-hydrolase [Acidimicrobiales bacterium]
MRGSTPAPGPEFVRYGGHTSCVAIATDGERPSLVLDAGTGIRRLGNLLDGEPFRGAILFGHLHWDHTQGLPFSRAVDNEGAEVDCYVPAQGNALDVLSRAMSPPHFPVTPDQLRGTWRFHSLEAGEHRIGAFSVTALDIPHKGGRTFGYRVTDGRSTLAYLSDHWPIALGPGPEGAGEYHETALALCDGADVVLHDSQYTAAELVERSGWGHSSIDYAVRLCELAGARRLLLFHHDPSRTDDQIDDLVRVYGTCTSPIVEAAAEGELVEL